MTSDSIAPSIGRFVTFEGGEGAGKSTQLARLRDRLSAQGGRIVTSREPGGSPRAEAIRSAVLAGRARTAGPMAEALLFAAARADHVRTLIRPALSRGLTVLCDRFIDSTRVYQGEVGHVSRRLLEALERIATGGLRPDLTIVLDVPAGDGLARVARRRGAGEAPDRFEGEATAYHAAVRQAFLALAAAEPDRCVVVDGAATPDQVAAAIWEAVLSRVPEGFAQGA